jgi:ATP-dependent Lon protease
METIELPGYSDEEKIHIAERYLVPKQLAANGLGSEQLRFNEEGLYGIIHGYTHEAGVRALERSIAAVCRKRARQIVSNEYGDLVVTAEAIRNLLGVPRYRIETELAERTRAPGVAVAVAWTPYGGDILFIETSRARREKGELTITGQVREVMQESAKTALSWLRANASLYGIEPTEFNEYDVHLHVPEGAVPKDGPSAGLAIAAALLSLFTNKPVRPHLAMTGEITLTGALLPVGGIKNKVLAARRSGVREMVLPAANEPNVLEELSGELRADLLFHFVDTVPRALSIVFAQPTEVAERRRVAE